MLLAQTYKALFDNTKNETAGNADWIIDTDQPIPAPAQSGITQSTKENYWLGAISAWGVDLVKKGFTVHTLTTTYGITYGNSNNPYDLSNYNLYIVCEPQHPFTASEKSAIIAYVQNGGSLFMVADHNASDRDNDGWDSPKVWNDLKADSVFGIHFQGAGETNNNISQLATNFASGNDSSIVGPAGTVLKLSYANGTTMNLLTTKNPSAQGHVWMNGATHGTAQVMAATSRYGMGRVAGIGDSSPADDSTGQSGNSLYNGWTGDGATDNILFINMCMWLVNTGTTSTTGSIAGINFNDGNGNGIKDVGEAGLPNWRIKISGTKNDSTLTDASGSYSFLNLNAGSYTVSQVAQNGWLQTLPAGGTYILSISSGENYTQKDFSNRQYFTITTTAGANGTISPSGNVTVNYGANQTFSITGNTGYHVDSVTVDGIFAGSVNSYQFVNVTGNHTIGAKFKINTYSIAASAGTNGGISPSGVVSVNYGVNQTFTITPSSGYHIDSVIVDGSYAGTVTSYQFSTISANHTITAKFKINTFTITSTASANGTISPSGSVNASLGSNQSFLITPNNGCYIDSVLVDGINIGAVSTYQFTNITVNHTIVAKFKTFTFAITSTASTNGTISPSGNVVVNYEASQSFTITPNANCHIDSVLVDGINIGVPSTYQFTNVTATHTINAKFSANITHTITASAHSNGNITPSGNVVVTFGQNQFFTITPNTNYHVDSVIVDGINVGSVTSYQFTNVTANHTIIATFAGNAFYTINSSIRGSGTILPFGNTSVASGGSQLYSITPDNVYHLDSVIVDGVYAGKVTSYQFSNVSVNHTIIAQFAINAFPITASAGTNGTIFPSGTVNVPYSSDQIFTFIPNFRYHVDSIYVDDIYAGNDGLYDFVDVTSSHTIRVTFKLDTFIITAIAGANGNITPSGAISVNSGTNQSFSFSSATGYHVDTVFIDGVDTSGISSYQFNTVSANHSISVTFKINSYTIISNAGAGGLIAPQGNVSVNHGSHQSFTILPNTGYHIDSVFADGVFAGAIASYQFTSVTTNHTIRATFQINTFTINASVGTNGTIIPSGIISVDYGTNKTFTCIPNTGYHIDSVIVDGIYSGKGTSYQFSTIQTSHSIQVLFARNAYTITASATGGGSVVPSGTLTVEYGMNQSFTFNPNAGYHISNVLLDGDSPLGAIQAYNFTNVTKDHFLAATFAIDVYTIIASSGNNGSISPSGTSNVHYGDSLLFSFTPNAGYHIDSIIVDDEIVPSSTTYTFTEISSSNTIRVTFAVNTFAITASAGENGIIFPSGTIQVNYGGSQTFTISPNALYGIDSIVVDGLGSGNSGSYSFTNITSSHAIIAFFKYIDSAKFRTFSLEDAGVKSLKLNKMGKKALLPSSGNWRDTVINRFDKKSGITLGLPQTVATEAKNLGWARFKKGTDFAKFYTQIQTNPAFNAPFDSVRKEGSNKKKRFVKELALNATSYTNPLVQAFGIFKLNLYSSQKQVTPVGLDSLVYDNSLSVWNGMKLFQIALSIDSVLTKFATIPLRGGVTAHVGIVQLESLRVMLNSINSAFDTTVALANGDSIVTGKGLQFKGMKKVSSVSFLKRVTGSKTDLQDGLLNTVNLPSLFALYQNYPNPFNPITSIGFSLPVISTVSLTVFDILGREVSSLINNEFMEEGEHQSQFNGSRLSSGIYFYRLNVRPINGANPFVQTKKLVLIK